MIEALKMISALFAGVVLGTFFFGGLWWTVQKGLASKQPAVLFLVSLLLRTLLVVTGFYFVSRDDWRNLVASLAGFFLARVFITRRLGSSTQVKSHLLQGEPQ